MDGLDMQMTSSTVNSYMMEPLHSQPHPTQMHHHHMSSHPNIPMNPQHHTQLPSYTHHYTQRQTITTTTSASITSCNGYFMRTQAVVWYWLVNLSSPNTCIINTLYKCTVIVVIFVYLFSVTVCSNFYYTFKV